jgi:oligoribonuclease NrnB/cAMP/cGMP phosphodiesterase (DHH superfamily)
LFITKDVIWIDHNASAIEKFRKFYQVGGIRDAGKAACVLTAKYLYPDDVVPTRVQYIGDWDTGKFEFGDYTKYFCSGLLMFETKPDARIWKDVFSGLTYFASEYGRTIWRYRTRNWADILHDRAYEVNFGGKLALACNFNDSCSFAFDSAKKDYDLFISFSYTGKVWKYNLYSKKIDVSKLAEEYGGGGNKGAASFTAEYRIL